MKRMDGSVSEERDCHAGYELEEQEIERDKERGGMKTGDGLRNMNIQISR